MASKPASVSPENAGSTALAQHPREISLESNVLSSFLPWPQDAVVSYILYAPATASNASDTLELARRHILGLRKPSVIDSVLCDVSVSRDHERMYAFAIGSSEKASAVLARLKLDGLTVAESSFFSPLEVFPCSRRCSTFRVPCSSCISPDSKNSTSNEEEKTAPASARFLPREPLREPYTHFIRAVRDALIDDACKGDAERLCRFKDSFLLFPQGASSDWGIGWEHHTDSRSLIQCTLNLTLTPSRMLVQPILRPTGFLPLAPGRTPPSGSSILLLPHGTPAYFLTTYSGPTSALTAQFSQSLVGLGCGTWTTSPLEYVIAWLGIQNKQGEEKGLTVIWPMSLTLAPTPSAGRPPLAYIPELPAQLQPSPPPPAAPTISLTSLTGSLRHSQTPPPQTPVTVLPPALARRPYPTRTRSSSAASLLTLRALSLSLRSPSNPDIGNVAGNVGTYVDAMAKERDRERERMKRERETGRTGPSPVSAPLTRDSSSQPGLPTPLTASAFGGRGSPSVAPPTSSPLAAIPPTPAEPPPPFYPSPPPTSTSVSAAPTVPPIQPEPEPVSVPVPVPVPVPIPILPPPPPPPATFDAFGAFDDWEQSSAPWPSLTDFMGMDVEMGAAGSYSGDLITGSTSSDFLSTGGGAGTSSGAWGASDVSQMNIMMDGGNMDMDDIFTEADFDFFESAKPTTTHAPPPPPMLPPTQPSLQLNTSGTGFTPSAMGMSPLFSEATQLSGPGPPSAVTPSGWLAPSLDAIPPELLPLSPTKTPASHSVPATPIPTVHVLESEAHVNTLQGSPLARDAGLRARASVFDPIPFASVHKTTDGKYTAGKFALPSPPDEEDRTQPLFLPPVSTRPRSKSTCFASSSAPSVLWWDKYREETDPSVGLVRQLRGVKRKSVSHDLGARDSKRSPSSWARGSANWERDVLQTPPPDDDEMLSDAESDDDDDGLEEEGSGQIIGQRALTPAPAYLPLGPTLLHTQFQHSYLLPISIPLKPPGTAAATPPGPAIGAGPVSAPTPVSPAALLGAASEKSKSLEAAAHILVHEVVESAVWSDAWRAGAADHRLAETRGTAEVWQADVRRVVRAFERLEGVQGPSLALGTVFGNGKGGEGPGLEKLEAPMVAVAKSDGLMQVLPTAIRFWQKLGLGPRAGRKDVTAFVLYEEREGGRQDVVEAWLKSLSGTYEAANFGSHVAGQRNGGTKDGLVPVKFDSFRKTLPAFVSSLPSQRSSYVFYIATPSSVMSLSSPVLRQVFSAVKRAQKMYAEAQILFQFVPDHVLSTVHAPSSDRFGMLSFASSVYDRILRPVDRAMSRRFFEHGERVRNYFQEPAYTLVPPTLPRVSLVKQHPVRAVDVVDRHAFLHVGYRTAGRWICAACVDQRGEAHDLGVWMAARAGEGPEAHLVSAVWAFACAFARRASVEWRVVITKLGAMSTAEIDAWVDHLDRAVVSAASPDLDAAHVSLFAAETDAAWTFIAPAAQASAKRATSPNSPNRVAKTSPGTVLADISSTAYVLSYDAHIHCYPRAPADAYTPYIVDPTDLPTPSSSSVPPSSPNAHLPLQPLRTTTLVRAPASNDPTAISMLHLHLLHACRSPYACASVDGAEGDAALAANWHALAVLARMRGLGTRASTPGLPWHLAALEVMEMALSECGGAGVGEG